MLNCPFKTHCVIILCNSDHHQNMLTCLKGYMCTIFWLKMRVTQAQFIFFSVLDKMWRTLEDAAILLKNRTVKTVLAQTPARK